MRYLLMCEGPNEELLINMLLDSNFLKISRDDLIGRKPYHLRQLKHPVILSELKHYSLPITIYRIGDTQTDRIAIPRELKKLVSEERIFKYCTKPELEILLIITEDLLKEYEKTKSSKSPKKFAKEYIKHNGIKYNQTNEWLENYYGRGNITKLVDSIKVYKTYKKHDGDELYLADLLK